MKKGNSVSRESLLRTLFLIAFENICMFFYAQIGVMSFSKDKKISVALLRKTIDLLGFLQGTIFTRLSNRNFLPSKLHNNFPKALFVLHYLHVKDFYSNHEW